MSSKHRGAGEGQIRLRAATGLWEARIRDGKSRRSVYGQTKAEVIDKLRLLRNDLAAGIRADAASQTLAEWLSHWLESVKPTVEPNTYGPYERHVRLHISPLIGRLKLAKVKVAQIRAWYAELAKGGVSPALQRKVGTTLTMALNMAIVEEVLGDNPALKVRKPLAAKAEMKPLDPAQLATFLFQARADRLYAFYHTAVDSGARPGELFALQWPDIDLEGQYLTISKSLEEINGLFRVKIPKSKKGRRRIDLSPTTIAILSEHRKAMLAEGHISGPVFCDLIGGYLRLSNLHRDSFKPLLRKAGLQPIRLYDLRHTCATLLLLADINPKIVQERLGHASVQITLDTYSHLLPTMQRRAAELMGRILAAPSGGGTMGVQA
jgi:integrase